MENYKIIPQLTSCIEGMPNLFKSQAQCTSLENVIRKKCKGCDF